eukprot:scaffold27_cov355-Prasinococcus_capsulatus_cf.AAC.2
MAYTSYGAYSDVPIHTALGGRAVTTSPCDSSKCTGDSMSIRPFACGSARSKAGKIVIGSTSNLPDHPHVSDMPTHAAPRRAGLPWPQRT